MNPDRRSVLKNLLVVAGGVTFLPSCLHKNDSTTSIHLNNLNLTGNDEQLLAELLETIIPKTNTPGAKDTYTHLYILKTINDCRTKEDQKKFEKGLKAFDRFVYYSYQKSFMKLTPIQRNSVLLQLEKQKDVPKDVLAFYKTTKGLTIQGFMSSKFYLTKVQVYEITPGRFKGCVQLPQPLKGSKKHV